MTVAHEPAQTAPLQLGRGLRILKVELVKKTGELETYDLGQSPFTFITGPRNSSKTTTVKVIDFCFGNNRPPNHVLGPAVDENYQAVAIEIATNGRIHRLVRDFGYGLRTKVQVDDDLVLETSEVSTWILERLGWPVLQIPLGVNAATARDETPLSFRSLFRHIYRREDSWTEFATQEEEFLRRAVISLFLGFAPARYESAAFEFGQAARRLSQAEAAHREAVESSQATILSLTRGLGLPSVVDSDGLDGARAELTRTLQAALAIRNNITRAAERAATQADTALGIEPEGVASLNRAAADVAESTGRIADLRVVLEEHRKSFENVQGEIQRLHRLKDSLDVFAQLPVRTCPACEQPINTAEHDHHPDCYVCGQEVTDDIRQRRAEREVRALQAELADLKEAIQRTDNELTEVVAAYKSSEAQRLQLTRELQDRRVSALAPFMAQLEDSAIEMGRLRQQIAALPALQSILARQDRTRAAVDAAEREYDRLKLIADEEQRSSNTASERCAQFADFMNEFLRNFLDRNRVWVGSDVMVSAEEVAFYVGTGQWRSKLGAEARVLFFLAYSYALVRLSSVDDLQTCAPGVLLLDNPYQQGVPTEVVQDALDLIGTAAHESGAQVVVTQARPAAGIGVDHVEIEMSKVYDDRNEAPE